ncbi:hypothetical protein [Spiroplasma endosymbiont of Labia minor]|uniref:hypothetical protein n=1 Tax=Spiroplasma endosymbiont of Labia minor TaxID=3066305 RepID=UPI0030D035D4
MENGRTLYLVAYVFQIIATCLVAWTLLPLAWMIPMTLATEKAIDEKTQMIMWHWEYAH